MNAESINIDKDTPPFVKSSDASEWYNASSNKSYVFSGDEAKSFNLIFKNESAKTDSFLKAVGDGASIVVKNLDSLEFLTTTALNSVPNNNNPIITSNGGTVTFDNINYVKFGTADTPLQVDQIAHLNWNGGDVTFSNIGTLDAYSQSTSFLVQSQPNNFPTLKFEKIETVNINAGRNLGIQIAASADISQDKKYTPLYVSDVTNFNVSGAYAGIQLSNQSNGGQYTGSANFNVYIQADNINITGDTKYGIQAEFTSKKNPKPSDLSIDLVSENINIILKVAIRHYLSKILFLDNLLIR